MIERGRSRFEQQESIRQSATRLDSSDRNYRSTTAGCRDSIRQGRNSVRYSMKLAGSRIEGLARV